MGVDRSISIHKMRAAIKAGLSFTRFYREAAGEPWRKRKTVMLADWRDVGQITKKKGLARFVRKGYVPAKYMAHVEAWAMSREYMYNVRCESILRPDVKPAIRFVNIMSDTPLTIEAIEREVWERSFTQSPPESGEERQFIVETAIRREPT